MTFRNLLNVLQNLSDGDLDKEVIVTSKDGDERTQLRGVWRADDLSNDCVSEQHGGDCPVFVIS